MEGGRWSSDDELAERFRAGDEHALRIAYDRLRRRGALPGARLLGNRADAEDVTQATFVAAWLGRGTFDPERGGMLGWLLGIARRKAVDRLRSAAREDRVTDDGPGAAGRRPAESPGTRPGPAGRRRRAGPAARGAAAHPGAGVLRRPDPPADSGGDRAAAGYGQEPHPPWHGEPATTMGGGRCSIWIPIGWSFSRSLRSTAGRGRGRPPGRVRRLPRARSTRCGTSPSWARRPRACATCRRRRTGSGPASRPADRAPTRLRPYCPQQPPRTPPTGWLPVLAAAAAAVLAIAGTVAVHDAASTATGRPGDRQGHPGPPADGPGRPRTASPRCWPATGCGSTCANLPLTTGYYEVWLIDPDDPRR